MIKKYFPVLFIIAIHAAFFGFAFVNEFIYLKDSYEYLNCAKNLLSDFTIYSGDLKMPFEEHLVSLRPPAYGAFIALIQFFSESHLLICLAQNILSILSFLLIIKISKILFQNNYTYLITFLFAFFPSQYVYANMIMSEVFFQFLLLLFYYYNVLFFKKSQIKFFLQANLIMCLLLLTKPVAIVIFCSYILFIIYHTIRKRIKLHLLIYSLIGILCLSTYQFYNYKKTEYFHYSSISSTYLLNYQLYPTLLRSTRVAQLSGHEDTAYLAQKIVNQINNSAEQESSFKNYSKQRVKLTLNELNKNRSPFVLLSLNGIINFFVDVGSWDLNEFFGNDYETKNTLHENTLARIYLLLIFCVNLILFLLFIYAVFHFNSQNKLLALALLIVIAVMLSTGLNGTARFRMPVYPFILLSALYAINEPRIMNFLAKFKLLSSNSII